MSAPGTANQYSTTTRLASPNTWRPVLSRSLCAMVLIGLLIPRNSIADSSAHFIDLAVELGLSKVHTGGGPEKGYIAEAKGGGAAVLDFDSDGDQDLYWVNGASMEFPSRGAGNALYRNEGSAGFVDVAKSRNAEGKGWGIGATSADYDNDGDPDLYLTNLQENILYRNDGEIFADISALAGVATPHWNTGAAWADYDLDGDLDLYVAGYAEFKPGEIERLGAQWKGVEVFIGPRGLPGAPDVFYRNEGDGTFADITIWARLNHPSPGYGLGVLFADADADGWPDLFVANDSSPNFFYHNRGDGRFTDRSLPARLAYGRGGQIQASMGVAWGDYDNDGDMDLFTTHFEGEYNTLYRNEGNGSFADISTETSLVKPSQAHVGFGTGFFDADNDGDLDLLVANGHVYPQIDRAGSGSSYAQPNHLFTNRGNGTFALLVSQSGATLGAPRVSRSTNIFDYDDDGDMDLFISNLNDRPALLRNDMVNGDHWLGLKLIGTHSNRDGIGARVRLVTGRHVQHRDLICGSSFLASEGRRLHFGLGRHNRVDSLEVRWPSRQIQYFTDLAVDQYLVIKEGTTVRTSE